MYIQFVHKHPDMIPFLQTLLSHTAQQTSPSSTISPKLQYIRFSIHRFPSPIPEPDCPNGIKCSIAKRRKTKYSLIHAVNPSLATRDHFLHNSHGFKLKCRHKALSEQEGRCNKKIPHIPVTN